MCVVSASCPQVMIKDIADSRRVNAHVHSTVLAVTMPAGAAAVGPVAHPTRPGGDTGDHYAVAPEGRGEEEEGAAGGPNATPTIAGSTATRLTPSKSGSGDVVMGTPTPEPRGGPTHHPGPSSCHLKEGSSTSPVEDMDLEPGKPQQEGAREDFPPALVAGADFSAAIVSHLFWPKLDPRDKEKASPGLRIMFEVHPRSKLLGWRRLTCLSLGRDGGSVGLY